MPQKTDTIDSTQTSDFDMDSGSRTSRSSEPPSFSKLAEKAKRNMNIGSFSSKTLGYIAAIFTLGFGTSLIPILAFSIPGGWFTTVFIVSILGSVLTKGSYAASGIAGGAIVGLMALLSGALFTFFFYALIGALIGVAGTALGDRLTD